MQLQATGTLPPGPDLHRAQLHGTPITALVVLPGGTEAIAGTNDGTLLRVALASQDVLERHSAHRGPIEHLAIHGDTLATASSDGTAQVWNLSDTLARRRLHGDATHALRGVGLGDRWLVTAGDDGVVHVYDTAAGTLLYELTGHRHPIRALTVDGPVAVSASIDRDVRVWDLNTGTSQPALADPPHDVVALGALLRVLGSAPTALQFLESHRVVAAIGSELVEWDLSQRAQTRRLDLGWPIQHLAIDGPHLVVATAVEVRRVHTDQWDRVTFRAAAPEGGATALSVVGNRILIGTGSGAVDVLTAEHWRMPEQHLSHAAGATISPDGTVAATVDHDHGVRLWSVTTGTPRAILDQAPAPGTSPVAFSGDGQHIAVGRRQGGPAVALYHHDGRPAGTLDHTPTSVQSLLFAWDGVLVGPRGPGPLQWWGINGTSVRPFFGETANVRRMALSGHRLVTEAVMPSEPGGAPVPHLQVWDLWRRCQVWSRPATPADGAPPAHTYGPMVVLADGRLLTGSGRSATEIGIYDLERGQITHRRDLLHPWTAAAAAPGGSIFVIEADPAEQVRELVQLDASLEVVLRRPLPGNATPSALAVEADRMAWAEGGSVVWTELTTGAERSRTELPGESAVTSLAISFDGCSIVAGGASGRVHVLRA